MNVRRAIAADRAALEAMHQAYLEALAAFTDLVDPHVLQDDWLDDPTRLYAYVFERDDELRGYLLVAGREYARAFGFETDAYVHELYVEPAERGTGFAERCLEAVLAAHPGSWAVEVLDANGPAAGFWRRVLAGRPELREESRGELRAYWFRS